MKNLILIVLLAIGSGAQASCYKKNAVHPSDLQPTKLEKRDDNYFSYNPKTGWQQTGHVQFYEALKNKPMEKTTLADGKKIYKIGEIEINEESFKWAADRRKEIQRERCCVIS